MWAAYVQPKGLADAFREERVAIGGAPGFARAAHRLVCLLLSRPVPLGVSRQSFGFPGRDGRKLLWIVKWCVGGGWVWWMAG